MGVGSWDHSTKEFVGLVGYKAIRGMINLCSWNFIISFWDEYYGNDPGQGAGRIFRLCGFLMLIALWLSVCVCMLSAWNSPEDLMCSLHGPTEPVLNLYFQVYLPPLHPLCPLALAFWGDAFTQLPGMSKSLSGLPMHALPLSFYCTLKTSTYSAGSSSVKAQARSLFYVLP